MATDIDERAVIDSILRACRALEAQADYLTSLDQKMGDGDIGISLSKIALALSSYVEAGTKDNIGSFLVKAGFAANKAGSSTMGTLLASALMAAGKSVMGKAVLTPTDVALMFGATVQSVRERGKAQLGDKTVLDGLHPANCAFAEAVDAGASVLEATSRALTAAEAGRDAVTPLRSRVGRASWVGDRTEGNVDPGCETLVVILRALAMESSDKESPP